MKLEIILEKGQARLTSPVYLKADAPHRFVAEKYPQGTAPRQVYHGAGDP